eukprot:CAMPEP_0198501518 /NCGR_PEP_ID=MMETSP1462-20131121/8757_1 /TAXON_ID=1333877 /ORGANISM="Brandtodinium nutriculum, Strain RCC3387" /LENGTH=481 /DNA_ID=CAMNT_0044230565 /DNA_START=30 /DNA_END=1477 /DNA_ORIENTATION=-
MSAIPALAWCKSLGFLCADSRAVVGVRVASRRCNFAARQLCADPEVRYRLEADAWHWKDILPCFCVKGNCLGVTGDLFVVADSGPLNSFAVELWGLKARSPVKTLNGHTNSVGAMDRVASAPNLLATGSRDCTVRIWDLNADTSMVLRGHKHWIHGVRFSPLGDKVVSGSEDKTARVWAVGTGALISTLACHTEFVFTVDFWQDTRVLTGGQDGQVVLWEETGEEVRKIPGRLLATLWDTLIAVTKDKTVMVYSAEALGGGEQAGPVAIMELVGYSDSAAFRPDGKQLAIAGWCDGKVFVHVWDILGGSRLFRLAVGSHRSTFELIYASTTGELLVLIGDEGCVQLWGDASAPGAVAAAGDANAPGAAALWGGLQQRWSAQGAGPGAPLAENASAAVGEVRLGRAAGTALGETRVVLLGFGFRRWHNRQPHLLLGRICVPGAKRAGDRGVGGGAGPDISAPEGPPMNARGMGQPSYPLATK